MKKFKVFLLLLLFFIFTAANQTFAHGNENSAAPDLHPLIVMLQFVLTVFIGFKFSGWLAKRG